MNDLFYLTDDQRMIRDLARKIARERVAPHAARYDEAEAYPEDSIRALVESGLYGIWVPEEYGGTDMGCLALALVPRRSRRRARPPARSTSISRSAACPSSSSATRRRRRSTCRGWPRARGWPPTRCPSRAPAPTPPGSRPPRCAAATTTCSTAPSSGAPTATTPTSSRCSPPSIRPSARTGITAFLVEKGTPGFEVGKKEKQDGHPRLAHGGAALHRLRACPSSNALGAEGEGFSIAMTTLDLTRPATGAMAVGIAAGRARRRRRLRPGAPAVRPADRRVPGHPVHAGRHGDADRTPRGSWSTTRRGRWTPGITRQHLRGVDGQVLRLATRP